MLRYSHGKLADGYDVAVQYYHGEGLFSTDQPLRAVQRGLIDRYGSLDPTDGTKNDRLSVSGHYARQGDNWHFASNGYYVRSSQTLYNNLRTSSKTRSTAIRRSNPKAATCSAARRRSR